jgi:predicted transcriptional regulator
VAFPGFDITKDQIHSVAMKAMTLRLDEHLQQSLDRFSALVGTPKNRLVNEAVRNFLEQRIAATESDLKATLKALQACRARDPNHEMAIRAFAESQADLKDQDPFEARIESGKGPVSVEIRRLLRG